MRKTSLILMNVLLSSIIVWAQYPSKEKFPLPIRSAQIGINQFEEAQRASSYLFDSLYFYRSDFDDFNTASEIRKVNYRGATDSLSNVDIYYHSAMTKDRDYNMAHSIRYSYYKCGDMNCVQEIFYDTDGQGNEQYDSRITYSYNTKSELISSAKELYFTDTQAWANNKKYEYEYNDEGKIDKVHFFMGTPWQAYYFEKYFYHPNGKIDKIERMTSNDKIKGDYLYRRTYNYDTDNILLSISDDKYMSGAWVFDYGVDFTYDDNQENIIAKETSSGFKFTYAYDNAINIADVTAAYYHYFDDYMIALFKHPVILSEGYTYDWGEWEKSTVKTFTYKPNMDKIDNHITNKGFKIYPNPISENYFTIDMDADEAYMTIMDAKATVVSCKKVRKAQQVNVSSLNNGVYIVQLEADELVAVQKIIISR